ncbi:hypothetical protein [Alkalilimnicola sp. S0819]|uniref:DsrE family protein n=1 Tax=Alkalilimnicola sp. S0819 TaxID=2613922 RepID=UPI0012626BED|nr:hypothetical protein [Alkalilimnicola sp. S0819]KAB7623905.1 hypothetical protein F3N43_07605 [Alkalilimnicola sp. S0819]MPQ16500.1 hypothetical protein [Alkalilimnicola sp. S0819]
MTELHVLLHAPTPEAFHRAQANARNLLKDEPAARVEIVVNGPALPAALALEAVDLQPLLRLCENSLAKQGLNAPAGLARVPAAVAYLARRQLEGWAYIRC